MQHNKILQLASGLLLFTLTGSVSANKIGETLGLAYDLENGELLYRETHCLSADGKEHDVIYQDADDNLIARKLLDYSSGRTTPSFVQHNFYSRESIEVALDQGTVSMAVVDKDKRGVGETTLVEPSAGSPVVIDAGFDGFVREHWDHLVAGNSREFQFPFADRASLVELRIQPLACNYDTQSDQCFRLDMANWLWRILVAPIELGYDAETRKLTRYRGLSNIGDGKGNGLVVDIRYSHDDIEPQVCQIIGQTITEKATGQFALEAQS